jgi:hypothetical protein
VHQEKKTIVSAAGPAMLPMLEQYALPSFERYADAMGYGIHVEKLDSDSSDDKNPFNRAARWAKLGVIRELLDTCDTLVWLDADVIICRQNEDIADGVHPDAFQGLALDWVPQAQRINPNTGVWVIRNNSQAFKFLDAVDEMGLIPGPWADQAAVMKVLGWEWDEADTFNYRWARPVHASEYLAGTNWLGQGWNQPDLTCTSRAEAWTGRPYVERPYAVHFMGMNFVERELKMRNLAQQLGFYTMPQPTQISA